jgi:predicted DNA-binding protein (UPF0251 family)
MLEAVELAADELEAIRLADFEGLYQEQAAEQMGVSRQTFGLIVARAHKKVAEALTQGKAICVEGASVTSPPLQEEDNINLSHLRKCEESAPPHGRGNVCGRGRHGRGCQ